MDTQASSSPLKRSTHVTAVAGTIMRRMQSSSLGQRRWNATKQVTHSVASRRSLSPAATDIQACEPGNHVYRTDIAICGAGAAGLTAAWFAAKELSNGSHGTDVKVDVFEKTSEAGKKILMSGGTRCNVLPASEPKAPDDIRVDSSNGCRNANNLLKSWSIAGCKDWLQDEVGIPLMKEEETNKFFPKSNNARDVRDKLLQSCLELGVSVHYWKGVSSIQQANDETWSVYFDDGISAASAHTLILATGGCSVPQSGTTGTGYQILKHDLGLQNIIEPYRALVPLRGQHPGGSKLPGISLQAETSIRAEVRKRHVKSYRTGFLFSHAGFSGPSVLDLSHFIVSGRAKQLYANFACSKFDHVAERLQFASGKKLVKNVIANYVPHRLAIALMHEVGIESETPAAQLTRQSRIALAKILTEHSLHITEPMDWSKAEVTAGGLCLHDLSLRSMEVKGVDNVHVIGELLETHGRIGGLNFLYVLLCAISDTFPYLKHSTTVSA